MCCLKNRLNKKIILTKDNVKFGEKDENGFCNLIVYNKPTNLYIFSLTKEQIEKWDKIDVDYGT